MRTRTLLLLAAALTVTVVAAAGVAAGGHAPSHSVRRPAAHPATTAMHASGVLRAWDHRRAAAWAHGDAAALADLYLPGSRTGRRDVDDLCRWRHRGLRVIGVRQQVAAIRVRARSKLRLVLAVTDRTVDAVAVGHRRRTALPVSVWATHRIGFRRVHGRWVVVEVSAQPAR